MRAFTIVSLLSSASMALAATAGYKPTKAVAVISGSGPVRGTVTLVQDGWDSDVVITYNLTGLDPSAKRGFHVHTAGDLTKGCASAGPHFNPFDEVHGAPADDSRHVGDLGNILSDATGIASGQFEDDQVKLLGPHNVIGRAIVVHAGTDDLGLGTVADSKTTGNAGGRPACGIIGLVI